MLQLACLFDGGLCIVAAIALGGSVLGWLGLKKAPDCQEEQHEDHCHSEHECCEKQQEIGALFDEVPAEVPAE